MRKVVGFIVGTTLFLVVMGGAALAIVKAYEIFDLPRLLMMPLIIVGELFAGWILVLIFLSEPFQEFTKWVERKD